MSALPPLRRCTTCCMPDTRPGSVFDKNGRCLACVNYDSRLDPEKYTRRAPLLRDLVRAALDTKHPQYDLLIPVSGGKDSHFLAHVARTMAEELGRSIRVLFVTVTDSFTHTAAGSANLRNLITEFKGNHWTYCINHDLFARATLWALKATGEALKFVEYAIYTVPYMLAQQLRIPLVFFGEDSAFEYGSSRTESLYANDVIERMDRDLEQQKSFWAQGGITSTEVDSIRLLPRSDFKPKVIYMSYFYPWSSTSNLQTATKLGFNDLRGEWIRRGTAEDSEQMDSKGYMVHLALKYPKFGFARVCDILSRRIREGRLTRPEALLLVEAEDVEMDPEALRDFCRAIGLPVTEFWEIVLKAKWNAGYADDYIKHTLQTLKAQELRIRLSQQAPL